MADENDIEQLSASVAERLQETPWQYYDSPDPRARETVHNHVLEIREDLDKIAEADPLRALKIWDENIPDEYEARAADPEPDSGPTDESNSIEPGGRRRRPFEDLLYERATTEWQPSPVDGFSSQEAFDDAVERMEEEGIARTEREIRDRNARNTPNPEEEQRDEGRPESREQDRGPREARLTVAGPRVDHGPDKGDSDRHSARDAGTEEEIDPADERRDARLRMLKEGLEKRYLLADDKYHFRDAKHDVAFEAGEKRLSTRHEDPAVITSMIDLAETRGWTDLKLSGSREFKREAWFQASLRGIDVSGYSPDKLDQARLSEYQAQQGKRDLNIVKDATKPVKDDKSPKFDEKTIPTEDEPKVDLSPGQKQVVSVLEKVMADRGDSPEAIAKAREIASERFLSNRVYVGKLVETGTAPYQDKQGEKPSHYVTLEDDEGKRSKVWGVDFPRALEDSGAVVGEKVVVAFGGRRQVTIDKPIKDSDGKLVGHEKADVMRNTWDIAKFDRLREDAKSRVMQAAQSVDNPSKLAVFDKSAPSQKPAPTVQPERPRSQERAI
jgi:putative DNA primase/helicase